MAESLRRIESWCAAGFSNTEGILRMGHKAVQHRFRHLDWFVRDFAPLGYSVHQARSGHLKITDPDGAYAGVAAATPSDRWAARNAQAYPRRWESSRRERVTA